MQASLKVGVGLRSVHYGHLETQTSFDIDFFEALTENYMDTWGRPRAVLEHVRSHLPVALHGVSLSIGSTDPLDENYLSRLNDLIDDVDPFVVSDHLCWTSYDGVHSHDLLPLPYTEEALAHVVSRVCQVQDRLKRRILLENVSSYLTYAASCLTEAEFISEVSKRSGCGILLDVNNVYVSAFNHDFDPQDYLRTLSSDQVSQIHLAGHRTRRDERTGRTFLFDDHASAVCPEVWALYATALTLLGPKPTCLEWDENIPSYAELVDEVHKARRYEVTPHVERGACVA